MREQGRAGIFGIRGVTQSANEGREALGPSQSLCERWDVGGVGGGKCEASVVEGAACIRTIRAVRPRCTRLFKNSRLKGLEID